ncbi:MAG: TetR/AcrR family transcriptional regulator [Burkholderiales bacterium]|nr:TetR/AcrR family transcriptional regulator [Burkholderiales bacterium]
MKATRETAPGGRQPGRPRSRDADRRILRATYRLVIERGYPELTMEAIALRAGVGKPTVYLRWPNKARLVLAAVLTEMDQRIAFPPSRSLRDTLRVQMRRLAKFLGSPQGKLIAMIFGGGQADLELLQAFREGWVAPRRAYAREVLRRFVELGQLDENADLELAIDLLYGPLFYRLLLRHAPLDGGFVDGIIDSVMGGFEAKSKRGTRGGGRKAGIAARPPRKTGSAAG